MFPEIALYVMFSFFLNIHGGYVHACSNVCGCTCHAVCVYYVPMYVESRG